MRVAATLIVLAALVALPCRRSRRAGGPQARVAVPTFVEEAAAAGVEHAYDGSYEFYVGGGVAVLDCDEDGRPTSTSRAARSPPACSAIAAPAGGALRFERMSRPRPPT